jgi:hypothetical protein
MKSPCWITKIAVSGFILVLTACSGKKEYKLLCKKWRTVRIENSAMAQTLDLMRFMRDSAAQAVNPLFGEGAMDSLAQSMGAELDSLEAEQQAAFAQTTMEFRKNGWVYNSTAEGTDSALFALKENQEIEIRPQTEENLLLRYRITLLTADTLKLLQVEEGDSTVAVMVEVRENT